MTAGIAGSFYAFLNAYISPDIFTFSDSIRFLLMVILGGAASTFGPVIGAAVLTYLPELLQQFAEWQKFAYGALLLLVMFGLPRGILGTLSNLSGRLRPVARGIDPREGTLAAEFLRDGARGSAELVTDSLTVRFGGLTALSAALGPRQTR